TLAHELAHVAGRDLLWNAALELCAALLWFHPLAWRMRVAHVDACDERCDAVAANVTADADGYGRLLAQVALQVAGGVPAVALPMARTPQVLRRIGLLSSGRGVATLSRRQ
ncbi:MAG TPA: M56 family metallopeptidase, partial [Verrucomicrobiae bacterium]|nr:M56 family metallopeptidase [Verrucomicrobiae bacterium]